MHQLGPASFMGSVKQTAHSSVDGLCSGDTSCSAFLAPQSTHAYIPRACSYACTVHMYIDAGTQREVHYLYNVHASIHQMHAYISMLYTHTYT